MKITETERLVIREASECDASFILALLNSPNWIEYIGDRNITTNNDAKNYIETVLVKNYREYGYGLYIMVLKGLNKPIGISGYVKRDYLLHPDIGFAVLPEFEGMGYSAEAAKSILNYGMKKLNMPTIFAITNYRNFKSRNLLKKIGLKESGMIMPTESDELLLLFKMEY